MTTRPITEANAAAWLSQPRAWAILPQTLAIVSAFAAGRLTLAEAVEQGSGRADEREPAPEGGRAVAVLGLHGLITPRGTFLDAMCGGGGGLVAFQEALAEAVEDDAVASIVLDVDSPGGVTDLVPETAAMIREARDAKPVVAVANALAASAAYWIASQASEVVVTPSGLVGSIGVYARHVDVSAMEEQVGIKTTLVSAGRYKTEGNPHEPLGAQARAHLQELVDDVYGQFVADVAAGRRTTAASVSKGYGEGRVLTAERAVAAHLADRVGTLDETVRRMLGDAPAPGPMRAEQDEAAAPAAAEDEAPELAAAKADEHEGDDQAAAEASRRARERLAALL